jgi:hypothetical protein
MSKTIYRTDANGELVHTYSDSSITLLQLGETYKAPPLGGVNQVAVLNAQQDVWRLVPDFRGTFYYNEQGVKTTITRIGDVVPNTAISTPPANKYYDSYDRINNVWVFNFNRCRVDLIASIEGQEATSQFSGISINNVTWDTDFGAHLKYTQMVANINRWDIKNIKDGTTTPFPPFEDFQINSDTYVDLSSTMLDALLLAIDHHMRNIFKWSKTSRDTVASTNNPESLMLLFTSLSFQPYRYDINGEPIIG